MLVSRKDKNGKTITEEIPDTLILTELKK